MRENREREESTQLEKNIGEIEMTKDFFWFLKPIYNAL
jgi:hypothetical protein